MADISERILQRLMGVISASVIDAANLCKELALRTKNKQEKAALEKLCMDVQDGNSNISLVSVYDVPFDEVKQFADKNGLFVASLRSFGDDYKIALVNLEDEDIFNEFVRQYLEKELEDLETEELEHKREEYIPPSEETEEVSEEEYSEEFIEEDDPEEKPKKQKKEKSVITNKKGKAFQAQKIDTGIQTSSNIPENNFFSAETTESSSTPSLYNKINSSTPVFDNANNYSKVPGYTPAAPSHGNKTAATIPLTTEYSSLQNTSPQKENAVKSVTNTNSPGLYGFKSSHVVHSGSNIPEAKNAHPGLISSQQTGINYEKGAEKKEDSSTYKISANEQRHNVKIGSTTSSALGRMALAGTDSWKDEAGGREIARYLPAVQMLGTIGDSVTYSMLKSSNHAALVTKHQSGHFVSLNHFLKTNNKTGINFGSEDSFNKTFSGVFGASGGGKSTLSQMGLNPYSMNKKEITDKLISRYGCGRVEAQMIAGDIFELRDHQNLMQMTKARGKAISPAIRSISRQAFMDNEGARSFIDGISTISSLGDLTATAYRTFQPTASRMLSIMSKPVYAAGQSISTHVIQPAVSSAKAKVQVAKEATKEKYAQSEFGASRIKESRKKSLEKARRESEKNAKKLQRTSKIKTVKKKISIKRKTKSVFIKKVGIKNYQKVSSFHNRTSSIVKKTAKYVGGSFKNVAVGAKAFQNNLLKGILKPLDLLSKLKKGAFVIIGSLLIGEMILGFFVGFMMIIFSTTFGLFEHEHEPTDNPLDTITGHTYLSLVKAEKTWAQRLMTLGTVQNAVAEFSLTKVDDLLYDVDDIEISEYAGRKNWSYDRETNTVKILDKPPFNGAPLEAYKPIETIDGGVEVTFVNGNGDASSRTSNIQDILSMSPVFFQQNFDALNRQEEGNLVTKLYNNWQSVEEKYSNLKKNLKKKWNEFVGADSIFRLNLLTKEDIENSMIERMYAESLFHASHDESFELEGIIFSVRSGSGDKDDSYTGPITGCPKAEDGGCYQYDNFFYLADGSLSGDNSVAAGDDVIELEDTPCTALTTDAEKDSSPCWKKTEEINTAITQEQIEAGVPNTYTVYTWECAGGHSGSYCGGHLTIMSTGKIYTISDEQINGSITGKVLESNPSVKDSITEEKIDENKIKNAKDIFDIDNAISHIGSPRTWNGWSKSNMEWAINVFIQDWKELYGIEMGSSVMFSNTFSLGEMADNLGSQAGVTLSDKEIADILAGKNVKSYGNLSQKQLSVLAQAYYWVGNIGYDQYHHGDQLVKGGYTDCSGFASRVWQNAGINIPLCTSHAFYSMSQPINDATIQPGDILVRKGHVSIFVGKDSDGKYIYIESNVFPGRGERGPGNIFCKTRSLSGFLSQGYQVVPIKNYE